MQRRRKLGSYWTTSCYLFGGSTQQGALYHRGLDLQIRYRFSFYDSLIVAAALEAGCKTLYSEDLQHAQEIEGLTIANPFRT